MLDCLFTVVYRLSREFFTHLEISLSLVKDFNVRHTLGGASIHSLSLESTLVCHTNCDTGPRFPKPHPKAAWHVYCCQALSSRMVQVLKVDFSLLLYLQPYIHIKIYKLLFRMFFSIPPSEGFCFLSCKIRSVKALRLAVYSLL